jgi:hypothetical protein
VNAHKLYYVPVASLDEEVRTAVEEQQFSWQQQGFAEDTEDEAAGELTNLEVASFAVQ